MAKNLECFVPPGGSTVVQYVDDLLVCSLSEEICHEDTKALLIVLVVNGHKVSPSKMQLSRSSVKMWVMTLLLRVTPSLKRVPA